MKNKLKITAIFFLIIAMVQVIVPLSMILKRETTLKYGKELKFKVAPIDPYDPFIGRYVALNLEKNYAPRNKNLKIIRGDTVFVILKKDGKGFAEPSGISLDKPSDEVYVKAKVLSVSNDKVYLDFKLNRYYMEEKAAPGAERVYRKYAGKKNAYIAVKVKDGFAVINGFFVGGVRIEDILKNMNG